MSINKKAIAISPTEPIAYYNLGVMLYNEASNINAKISSDLDEGIIAEMTKYTKALMEESLPYFEKFYSMSPNDETTKNALIEIYTSLEMDDKLTELMK